MLDLSDAGQFEITAALWLYSAPKAAWHFFTIPTEESAQIKFLTASGLKRGWGAVRVQVRLGQSQWQTSIFPESKTQTFLLPVKASIRKAEKLAEGESYRFHLHLAG